MKMIVLRPRQQDKYGQDFRSSMAIKQLSLTPMYLENGLLLQQVDVSGINLAITFDPENVDCNKYIESLSNYNIPLVSHFHLQWEYQTENERIIAEKTIKRSNAVIVPAAFLKEQLKSKFPDVRIECIHNGADNQIFNCSDSQERKKFREEELNIAKDEFVFVYVGSLTKPKGLQIIYEFCKIIPQDYHLLFYCRDDSVSKEEITNLLEVNPQQIHVLYDNNDQIREKHPVRLCDCLITFSLSEVAPMVVIEALLSGVKVIGTSSTQFYEELPNTILDKRFLQLINLPTRLNNLSHDKLFLENEEVNNIINNLIKYTKNMESYSDTERKSLSQIMIDGGYEAREMIKKYKKLYDEIADKT